MNNIHETLKEELKRALKAKDEVRLRTVRSMLTAFTNELVAEGQTPQDTLSDEKATAVAKRLFKQRTDSIQQYEAAGRDDLATPEKEEQTVLEEYLPEMLTEEEIVSVVKAKKAELGVSSMSEMGTLIGAVMKELKGEADGSVVKTAVEKELQ